MYGGRSAVEQHGYPHIHAENAPIFRTKTRISPHDRQDSRADLCCANYRLVIGVVGVTVAGLLPCGPFQQRAGGDPTSVDFDGFERSYAPISSNHEINLQTLDHRIVASGLRNPQGLMRDDEGRVWATEHGPRGRDELNLIQPGKNYVWPYVTLGTDYSAHTWPLTRQQVNRRKWQISPNLGADPVWRSDGRELFFTANNRIMIMSQSTLATASALRHLSASLTYRRTPALAATGLRN